MRHLNTAIVRHRRGFLLQEVIVGVVIFGIAMFPILKALVLLPRVSAYAASQGRAESWRSASDGFVASGIDAEQSLVLHSAAPNLNVAALSLSTTRKALTPQQGAPQITLLSEEAIGVTEERARPMGFEIGATVSSDLPRSDPLSPLPEIKLTQPTLTPNSGTFLNALALLPVEGGYGSALLSTGAASVDRVFIQEVAPDVQGNSSQGAASLLMTAGALAHAFNGVTWSEFAGNQETDTRIALDDGRARWLVKVGQQIQIYEPSDAVPFIYGVDLGRPVFEFSGAEYPSGSEVSINFVEALSISNGSSLAMISYPAEVRDRFGGAWAQIEPRFQWTFGGALGDSSSGNTASIFSSAGRSAWNESQTLSAEPDNMLAGVRSWTGSWTLLRSVITLSPPERLSTYYDSETDEAGVVDFAAPMLSPIGLRVGRPEIDGIESVGTTLSSVLVP